MSKNDKLIQSIIDRSSWNSLTHQIYDPKGCIIINKKPKNMPFIIIDLKNVSLKLKTYRIAHPSIYHDGKRESESMPIKWKIEGTNDNDFKENKKCWTLIQKHTRKKNKNGNGNLMDQKMDLLLVLMMMKMKKVLIMDINVIMIHQRLILKLEVTQMMSFTVNLRLH